MKCSRLFPEACNGQITRAVKSLIGSPGPKAKYTVNPSRGPMPAEANHHTSKGDARFIDFDFWGVGVEFPSWGARAHEPIHWLNSCSDGCLLPALSQQGGKVQTSKWAPVLSEHAFPLGLSSMNRMIHSAMEKRKKKLDWRLQACCFISPAVQEVVLEFLMLNDERHCKNFERFNNFILCSTFPFERSSNP